MAARKCEGARASTPAASRPIDDLLNGWCSGGPVEVNGDVFWRGEDGSQLPSRSPSAWGASRTAATLVVLAAIIAAGTGDPPAFAHARASRRGSHLAQLRKMPARPPRLTAAATSSAPSVTGYLVAVATSGASPYPAWAVGGTDYYGGTPI